MVFCYQNCSDLVCEKIVLVIKKFSWLLDAMARTIFGNRMLFNFVLGLEQLEFKLEIIGI